MTAEAVITQAVLEVSNPPQFKGHDGAQCDITLGCAERRIDPVRFTPLREDLPLTHYYTRRPAAGLERPQNLIPGRWFITDYRLLFTQVGSPVCFII